MHTLRSVLLALPLFFALTVPVQAQGWGTVKGKVEYVGKKPAGIQIIKPDKDQQHCKDPIPDDMLMVNAKNKGVRWAVIWLAKDDSGKADHTAELPTHPSLKEIKEKEVSIDQPCCRFEPHVAVLRVGQDFVGKNSAKLLAHNFHITGNAVNQKVSTNPILPPGGSVKVPAAKWRPYHLPNIVNCDIHKWMFAYIFVFPHPYFAVTDENGNFEIKNAPAGKYRLAGWRTVYLLGDNTPSKNGKLIEIEDGKTTDVGKIPLDD